MHNARSGYAPCRMQRRVRTFKDSPVLIKINELSEKSRPRSRVVINSLFHLPIDGSRKLYSRERPGSFSSFHPHPRRIILRRSTYYGKSSSPVSLLPSPPSSLLPYLLPRLHLSNSDASICETLFVKTKVIIRAVVHIVAIVDSGSAASSSKENPLL